MNSIVKRVAVLLVAACVPMASAWAEFLMPVGIALPGQTYAAASADDLLNVAWDSYTFDRASGAFTYSISPDRTTAETNAVSLDFQFLGISDNTGLTFKVVWDIGVDWSTQVNGDDAAIGMQTSLDVGLGWTPLRLDRFYLTVTGFIGFDIRGFSEGFAYTSSANQGTYRIRDNEVKQSWVFADFHVGFDVYAYIRFGEMMGIYGGIMCKKPVAVGGSYNMKQSQLWGKYYAAYDGSVNKSSKAETLSVGLTVMPSFGICIFF